MDGPIDVSIDGSLGGTACIMLLMFGKLDQRRIQQKVASWPFTKGDSVHLQMKRARSCHWFLPVLFGWNDPYCQLVWLCFVMAWYALVCFGVGMFWSGFDARYVFVASCSLALDHRALLSGAC